MGTFGIRARVLAAAWVALALGCSKQQERPAPAAPDRIRLDRESYALQPDVYGPRATIVVTFAGRQDRPLYITNCNGAYPWGVQTLVDGKWTNAWVAMLNGCMSEPIVIPAGGTFRDTLILQGRAGAVLVPKRDGELEPGTYRLACYGLMGSFDPKSLNYGDTLSIEEKVSAPFRLERAP